MDRRKRRAAPSTPRPVIPDKHTFKIGEVSRITGVKPHVLRYWETEFPAVRPEKSRTNQRLYHRRHVETLLLIKQLLYQEGFTIAGANKRLRDRARQHPLGDDDLRHVFDRMRQEVQELLEIVEEDG